MGSYVSERSIRFEPIHTKTMPNSSIGIDLFIAFLPNV